MKILYPSEIVWTSGKIDNVKNLSVKKSEQIGLTETVTTVMNGKSSAVIDFGKEIAGSVRILCYTVKKPDNKIRLRFGESVSEVMHGIGEKNSTNDHSVRDMTVELENFSDMVFGKTGFRFIRIDSLSENSVFEIKSVLAETDIFSKKFIGNFSCDDQTVNKIFNTAAYTLRLCLQNGMIWDGIKRDRLVWIGDIHPEMMSVTCLFGSLSNIEKSLTFVKEQSPLPSWMNNIPMYSFWWIIILHDYYIQNNNYDYLIKQKEYIVNLVGYIDGFVKENGETDFPSNFIDWPTHDEDGTDFVKLQDELAGVNALAEIAFKKAKKLLEIIGEDTSVCSHILEKLSRKTFKVKKYKQIAALESLAGVKNEYNRELLLDGGAEGMSTFMSYYILKAVSDYGDYNEALNMTRDYYGGMLKMGATTFWEDFDIKWMDNAVGIDKMPIEGKTDIHGDFGAYCYKGLRHSMCHGWSSGVIPYLMRVVLGVEVVEAGCKKVRINPHLSGLKFVKGEYPTPYGVIKIEHTLKADGTVESNIEAPNEVEIIK